MDIQRLAAFSHEDKGGNPAGVVLLDEALPEADMARIAAEVGYSETAFAVSTNPEGKTWRVRYFSPESEVPFCGHATIALGAVLGQQKGAGLYHLTLNHAAIEVSATPTPQGMKAKLSSPPTKSRAISEAELSDSLRLFGLKAGDLDERLPAARIHGGADHIMLALKDRATLADMHYSLDEGREMMRKHDLVTIMLVHVEEEQVFNVRNAFASGGVLEDPATGAAAAAFAGYLRDLDWPYHGNITIKQGEDMGSPSLIEVEIGDVRGEPVQVFGLTRAIG